MKIKFWKKPPSLNLFKNIKRYKPVVVCHEIVTGIVYGLFNLWQGITIAVYGAIGLTAGQILGAILVAGSILYSYSQSQKAKKTGQARGDFRASGHLINTTSQSEPIPIPYGTCRMGGNVVYKHCTGTDNKYYHRIITFGYGPVNGPKQDAQGDKIWLDDKRIQDFGSLAYWEFFYGTSTQNVCTTLQAAHPEFDDAMRDIAYLYLRLEYNSDKFASEPQVTIEGEWRKIYDPRSGQTVFSANNALVAYDFLRSDLYSIGLPAIVFDIDLIKDAANWCDANGYQFNGPIMDRQALLDNFEVILQNFRAGLVWSEGLYKLLVYEYDTPVMHLTEDDIEADSFKIIAPGIPETPNRVLITYIDAVNNYVSKTKPIEDPQAVLIYDGEERDFEIDLKGTTNALQAEKLGGYYIERNRLNLQFPLVAHPRALALDPMDMIQITHSMPGWTEKIVRVIDVDQRQDGKVNLLVLAEISSLYNDDIFVADHQHYDTTLPDPLAYPPEVTNLAFAETTDATGITISFSIPGKETNWSHGEIFVSKNGGVTWQSVTTFNTNAPYVYRDVVAGSTYYFKIISYSTAGVASLTPPTNSITMAGVSGIAPTNLTATSTFKYIILDWVNPITSWIQYIEVWRSDTNNRAAATMIATVYDDFFFDLIGTTGITKYYWIRAKNPNGGVSTWLPSGATNGVYATTAQINASDLIDASIVSAKLADSAVITSKLADLAVDNTKLAALAVDAAKLAGSAVTTEKIANLAVGSAAIAALAVGTGHLQDACIQTAKIGDLQVLEGKIGSLAITNAKIADGAILNAKIGNLAVDSAKIANLTVGTLKITGFAVTRGIQYHSATPIAFHNTTEIEIGTITLFINELTDSIWIWASVMLDIIPTDAVGKYGVIHPFRLKIRRCTTTGLLISSAEITPLVYMGGSSVKGNLAPVILMGTDIPGGSIGGHIYKFTVATDNLVEDHIDGLVGYRQIIGLAKSR